MLNIQKSLENDRALLRLEGRLDTAIRLLELRRSVLPKRN